jgi:hypothetical protein
MLRYELRTTKEQRTTMWTGGALFLGLVTILVLRVLFESGVTMASLGSLLPPFFILSILPISLLVFDRRQWNSIEIQEEGFIVRSRLNELVFLTHTLKYVRTHTMKQHGVRYGVVRVRSHIKDMTFRLNLNREHGTDVLQWFEQLESEQTGNTNTQGLEGPDEAVVHVGYPKKHQWMDKVSDVLVPVLTIVLLLGWIGFVLVLEIEIPPYQLVISVLGVGLALGIVIKTKAHLPGKQRIVQSTLERHRLLLEDMAGDVHQVRMEDIREIKQAGRRDRGLESLTTYRITTEKGSWLITVRDGVEGGVALKRWLKDAVGEHGDQ